MHSKNLPPIPPPPPDYTKRAKIAIALVGIATLLTLGLSLGRQKHEEATYQGVYERLNTLLSNEEYEPCIADSSTVSSKYKGNIEWLKARCKTLYLSQLVESATKEPSRNRIDFDSWKEILSKIDRLAPTEQDKARLRSEIFQSIKHVSDGLLLEGEISQALSLLRLVGDNGQAKKLAEDWELERQRFENSMQTITDVNAKTHNPFANSFTTQYKFPYWQKRFEAMIAEIESKRSTRLLTQAEKYAERRDWSKCMQLADQVRHENTDYKSTIQLEANRKANQLLKTCNYAQEAEAQQQG